MTDLNSAMIYQDAVPTWSKNAQLLRLTQLVSAWDTEEANHVLLAGDTVADVLAALFDAGNDRRELLPELAYSVSVGDVIALVDTEGDVAHYLCTVAGWTKVRGRESYDADHAAVLTVPAI